MRTILIVAFSFLLFNTTFAQDEVLVWSDEFDVDGAPNSANWGYDLGNNGGWGNNELESYTNKSENIRVSGGLLIVDALKSGSSWTSARLKSQNKINFTYGKIKFKAKLASGTGTWPALWMLAESITSKGWPACGEIDVMEHVGKDPGVIHSTLHTTSSYGNSVNTKTKTVNTFDSEFHEYEAYWTADKIQFSIDGVAFYTYQPATKTAANWPFNTPFFIIMNLAIGGNFGGAVDPALTSAEMQVDYVRVYKSVTQYSIIGPKVVHENQTGITYEFEKFDGATYDWTIPADAAITSGTGTNKITVDWGHTDGNVGLTITITNPYQTNISVVQTTKPEGSPYILPSANFWKNNKDNGNLYIMSSQLPMRIDYTVAQKLSTPSLIGTFPRAIDLSDHPVMNVKIKTKNKSKTVNLRMDYVDANGLATVKSPVFDFIPVIDDGEYYKYKFDFLAQNKWASTNGTVDKSRISKINFFIDYGINALTGYDSIWVDTLWVENSPVGITKPNRPSHLEALQNGSIMLQWRDNAEDETGFEIYKALSKQGPFTSIKTVAANSTSATIDGSTEQVFYIIKSFNSAGHSYASNSVSSTDIITGLPTGKERTIKIYPNPSSSIINVELPEASNTLHIHDILGREILRFETITKKSELDLTAFPKGTYYLQIISRGNIVTKKITLD